MAMMYRRVTSPVLPPEAHAWPAWLWLWMGRLQRTCCHGTGQGLLPIRRCEDSTASCTPWNLQIASTHATLTAGSDAQERIAERSPQLPQMFQEVRRPVPVILPGHHLKSTCLFNSSTRSTATMSGWTHDDEMCNMCAPRVPPCVSMHLLCILTHWLLAYTSHAGDTLARLGTEWLAILFLHRGLVAQQRHLTQNQNRGCVYHLSRSSEQARAVLPRGPKGTLHSAGAWSVAACLAVRCTSATSRPDSGPDCLQILHGTLGAGALWCVWQQRHAGDRAHARLCGHAAAAACHQGEWHGTTAAPGAHQWSRREPSGRHTLASCQVHFPHLLLCRSADALTVWVLERVVLPP